MKYLVLNQSKFPLRWLFLVLSFLYMNVFAFGQSKPNELPEFGEVDPEHLAMTFYDKDSSVSAVMLFDNGLLGFNQVRNKFTFGYHAQIKILNSDGFEFADVSLPFEGRKGLAEVRAATHNLENGELVTHVVTEEMMRREEVLDKNHVQKIVFPAVVAGSVIEYSYVVYSDNPFEFLPWYFQGRIPVITSSFTMFFPRSDELKPRVYGYHDLHSYDLRPDGRHTLVMRDIPAFKKEAYVKKIDDHYSKVDFEYISNYASSWESLIDFIIKTKGFDTTLQQAGVLKKIYPSEREWKPDLASLKDIHTYVADHFQWNRRHSISFSDKPKKVWEASEGTSADINLTLYLFLRKAGFQVDPVLLSTTNHGLINSELPTTRQFNHVVVMATLGGEQVLLDATSKLRPYNVLPNACLNDRGLVLIRGKAQWVPMNLNKEISVQSISVRYEMSESAEISGSGNIRSSGAAAANIRETLADKDKNQLKERMEKRLADLEVEKVTYSGLDDAYASQRTDFSFYSDSFSEQVGQRIFFRPLVLKELETNPFKPATRSLSIDFVMPVNKKYFFNISVSDVYEIEELPESVTYSLPNGGGSYSYRIQEIDGNIQVLVRFTINRLMFLPQEYPNIREMFNLILAKQEERVVLKKK